MKLRCNYIGLHTGNSHWENQTDGADIREAEARTHKSGELSGRGHPPTAALCHAIFTANVRCPVNPRSHAALRLGSPLHARRCARRSGTGNRCPKLQRPPASD